MLREIGAVMFVLGSLFMLLSIWSLDKQNMFMFQLLTGPVFIYLGLQLLK